MAIRAERGAAASHGASVFRTAALTACAFLALGGCVLLGLGACTGAAKPAVADSVTTPVAAAVVVADPQLVELIAEPSAALVGAGGVGQLAVRLRITAKAMTTLRRPALNLALVIDTSGSMEGEPIAAARAAALAIVDRLRDGDRLSVTVFHTGAEALVPLTIVDADNRVDIRGRLGAIAARGTTDLTGGLAIGLAQLGQGLTADGLNRLVLLSDGVPNDATAISGLVQQAINLRAPIAALGFGVDHDETLLGALAMQTGGGFHYLEQPDEVVAVFDDEVVRMTQLVGRNLQLTLQPGPGVSFAEIPGYASAPQGAARVVTVGDLATGESRDVIVPLTVAARRHGAAVELLDAALAFEDVAAGSGWQTRSAFVAVHASADAGAVAASVQLDLELALARAVAAGSMIQAIAQARSGQLELARQLLRDALTAARAAQARHHDDELAALIGEMEKLEPALVALVPPLQLVPPEQLAPGIPEPTAQAPDDAPQTIKQSYAAAQGVLH